MLTIVDYGVGNLTSIKNMFKKIGYESCISSQKEVIADADKLILPGVGSFDYGMQQLHESGLVNILTEKVLEKKIPLLGICLGVQLLTQSSEEGTSKGLGWIKGKTIAFDKMKLNGYKVPHMGWAEINNFNQSRLFTNMPENPRFYFVHSYHLTIDNESDILATSNYRYEFPVGIEHENILGVQFHPEKSHKFGMKLLENFIKYY